MKKKLSLVLITIFVLSLPTKNFPFFGSYTFNKAQLPIPETRESRPWLTSFDAEFFIGSTEKSEDQKGNTTELLNLYGLHNMKALGTGVTNLDPTKTEDNVLIALNGMASRDNFGMFEFKGKYSIKEVGIDLKQNFSRGFFAQILIPIVSESTGDITYTDKSPDGGTAPNKNSIEWQNFLAYFDRILEKYKLNIKETTYEGLGDVGAFVGWTYNNKSNEQLDFLNATIKTGVLFPVSTEAEEGICFDPASGSNGHRALNTSFDVALGAYDWLTIGIHGGALLFLDKNKEIRIRTSSEQNGFIKLEKAEANISPATTWTFGTYLKAEHFLRNLSFKLAYSFVKKGNDIVNPKTNVSSTEIASKDSIYQDWHKQTLHLNFEYDFGEEEAKFNPKVGFSYNYILDGKRVFKTNLWGGSFGLDIALKF